MNSRIPGGSTLGPWEQNYPESICVVLLVGIPGSGKSHFCTFLENYFKTNTKTVLGTIKVFSVSYDDFYKVRNPTEFSDNVSWKEDRLEILKIFEKVIINLKNYVLQDCETALGNIRVINYELKNPDTVLFLIDDNMYYRSMRYEYYKLSRSYNLSFCQIFFDATIQDALKYNKKRETHSQVPDFVIEKMFEKLEPPDKSLLWEKHLLNLTPYSDLEKDFVLDSFFSVIKTALKCPVQENLKSLDREKAQWINSSNAIHQIDILLKQLVGNLIKKRIKESNDNPSLISQYFSEQRHEILKKIKDRKIVLPVDLSEPISKQEIELIKPILTELINSIT